MSLGTYVNAIFLSVLYRFNLRDTNLIIGRMGKWVKGVPSADLEKLCLDITERFLFESIHPEIIGELNYHRQENAEIVMLSSAISFICYPIARHLGIKNVICSHLEVNNGKLTGNPAGKFIFGKEKGIRLTDYCLKNNFDPEYAWHYGDSVSDLSAFEASGTKVCINPDNKLRKIALHRGWRIENW
jgi:HAD superfamily phosphoserine phosphatase-like hydrolase